MRRWVTTALLFYGAMLGVAVAWSFFADRSLLSLLAAAILGGTAAGAVNVLWVYINSYFWELESW